MVLELVRRPASADLADRVDAYLHALGYEGSDQILVRDAVAASRQRVVDDWSRTRTPSVSAPPAEVDADALLAQLDELGECAPGTLGRSLHDFLDRNRFTYEPGHLSLVGHDFAHVIAGYEAVGRLIHPRPIEHVGWVALAGLLGFIGNEWVALYRIRVGRRIGSAALVADGLHARTDGFTSLAVLLGAGGVALGFPLADPVVGLVITVAILAVLCTAGRDVFRRLMDGVDPGLVETAQATLAARPGVRSVRSLRMRWIGHRLHADAELDIDPDLTLAQAHLLAHDAEHDLVHAVPKLATAMIHAYPAV